MLQRKKSHLNLNNDVFNLSQSNSTGFSPRGEAVMSCAVGLFHL